MGIFQNGSRGERRAIRLTAAMNVGPWLGDAFRIIIGCGLERKV